MPAIQDTNEFPETTLFKVFLDVITSAWLQAICDFSHLMMSTLSHLIPKHEYLFGDAYHNASQVRGLSFPLEPVL